MRRTCLGNEFTGGWACADDFNEMGIGTDLSEDFDSMAMVFAGVGVCFGVNNGHAAVEPGPVRSETESEGGHLLHPVAATDLLSLNISVVCPILVRPTASCFASPNLLNHDPDDRDDVSLRYAAADADAHREQGLPLIMTLDPTTQIPRITGLEGAAPFHFVQASINSSLDNAIPISCSPNDVLGPADGSARKTAPTHFSASPAWNVLSTLQATQVPLPSLLVADLPRMADALLHLHSKTRLPLLLIQLEPSVFRRTHYLFTLLNDRCTDVLGPAATCDIRMFVPTSQHPKILTSDPRWPTRQGGLLVVDPRHTALLDAMDTLLSALDARRSLVTLYSFQDHAQLSANLSATVQARTLRIFGLRRASVLVPRARAALVETQATYCTGPQPSSPLCQLDPANVPSWPLSTLILHDTSRLLIAAAQNDTCRHNGIASLLEKPFRHNSTLHGGIIDSSQPPLYFVLPNGNPDWPDAAINVAQLAETVVQAVTLAPAQPRIIVLAQTDVQALPWTHISTFVSTWTSVAENLSIPSLPVHIVGVSFQDCLNLSAPTRDLLDSPSHAHIIALANQPCLQALERQLLNHTGALAFLDATGSGDYVMAGTLPDPSPIAARDYEATATVISQLQWSRVTLLSSSATHLMHQCAALASTNTHVEAAHTLNSLDPSGMTAVFDAVIENATSRTLILHCDLDACRRILQLNLSIFFSETWLVVVDRTTLHALRVIHLEMEGLCAHGLLRNLIALDLPMPRQLQTSMGIAIRGKLMNSLSVGPFSLAPRASHIHPLVGLLYDTIVGLQVAIGELPDASAIAAVAGHIGITDQSAGSYTALVRRASSRRGWSLPEYMDLMLLQGDQAALGGHFTLTNESSELEWTETGKASLVALMMTKRTPYSVHFESSNQTTVAGRADKRGQTSATVAAVVLGICFLVTASILAVYLHRRQPTKDMPEQAQTNNNVATTAQSNMLRRALVQNMVADDDELKHIIELPPHWIDIDWAATLGSGAFGTVYEAKFTQPPYRAYLVAAKVPDRDPAGNAQQQMDDFLNECVMLSICQCEYVAQISDFGMAKRIPDGQDSITIPNCKVACRWASPEIYVQHRFSEKSEVYAWGVTLWELLENGRTPYSDHSARGVWTQIRDSQHLACPADCPAPLYNLMQKCWATDYRKRLGIDDLVAALEMLLADVDTIMAEYGGSRGRFCSVRNVVRNDNAASAHADVTGHLPVPGNTVSPSTPVSTAADEADASVLRRMHELASPHCTRVSAWQGAAPITIPRSRQPLPSRPDEDDTAPNATASESAVPAGINVQETDLEAASNGVEANSPMNDSTMADADMERFLAEMRACNMPDLCRQAEQDEQLEAQRALSRSSTAAQLNFPYSPPPTPGPCVTLSRQSQCSASRGVGRCDSRTVTVGTSCINSRRPWDPHVTVAITNADEEVLNTSQTRLLPGRTTSASSAHDQADGSLQRSSTVPPNAMLATRTPAFEAQRKRSHRMDSAIGSQSEDVGAASDLSRMQSLAPPFAGSLGSNHRLANEWSHQRLGPDVHSSAEYVELAAGTRRRPRQNPRSHLDFESASADYPALSDASRATSVRSVTRGDGIYMELKHNLHAHSKLVLEEEDLPDGEADFHDRRRRRRVSTLTPVCEVTDRGHYFEHQRRFDPQGQASGAPSRNSQNSSISPPVTPSPMLRVGEDLNVTRI
ncbi:uncharacterized protein MONBRDRAFT_38493 [Monosiga brevicollis MX1]|uniref:Protein kinase domain-containing protein n=1 Tax=Monosiga brevicollis TaxID=81824 RepID=A9V865_MONBE|nr:uncharacterized protein MONBRDRAFT_38493 [Monosiga brevicollis MX1]EDQ86283.1 predicted protein [Monosiga brevicollis MX1]|eukprot:XP_001748953.1 hypothetical protein [Monosiga brevicollis MX1]